jgi:hypothetical protein
MAQAALLDAPPKVFDAAPRVILLYGPALPEKQFLCLAFREGVDDVVALDAGEERSAFRSPEPCGSCGRASNRRSPEAN